MKLAYLDCAAGISGDMMLGALVDAGVGLDRINEAIGSLGLTDCRLVAREVKKHGFRATKISVEYAPEHAHRHLSDILALLERSNLSGRQRDLARRIFSHLAQAEAKVHGTSIEEVHFHEVGAADSIADIVGSAVGWDLLGVDRLVASPVPTGSGTIRIAHGQCSVPAPATAELLRGVPLVSCAIEGEMTTPTGAAILTTLAADFGPLPAMRVETVGLGAGTRDWPSRANLLRLFVGEALDFPPASWEEAPAWIVETNVDDVSGEIVGYCTTRLWEAGALDVFTTAIQMKKNRPGTILSILCREPDLPAIEAVLFEETTTLGVRRWPVQRHVLRRRPHRVETAWGSVEGKIAWTSENSPRFAPEYESCRQLAKEQGIPLLAVYEAAHKAFDPATPDNQEANS